MIPILLALAFIAILFLVFIAGQPDEFKISRSAKISALPDKIFPHINDLHKWEAWSPWAKKDPACKNSYEGSWLCRYFTMTQPGANDCTGSRLSCATFELR